MGLGSLVIYMADPELYGGPMTITGVTEDGKAICTTYDGHEYAFRAQELDVADGWVPDFATL